MSDLTFECETSVLGSDHHSRPMMPVARCSGTTVRLALSTCLGLRTERQQRLAFFVPGHGCLVPRKLLVYAGFRVERHLSSFDRPRRPLDRKHFARLIAMTFAQIQRCQRHRGNDDVRLRHLYPRPDVGYFGFPSSLGCSDYERISGLAGSAIEMTIALVHLRTVFTPFTHRPWSAILSHETGAQRSRGCHQILEALGPASENGSSGPSPMQRPCHIVPTPLQMLNGQDLREDPSSRITAWLGSIEMTGDLSSRTLSCPPAGFGFSDCPTRDGRNIAVATYRRVGGCR
nr:hypothetical protein CFP56_09036 [Quercus suber]